MIANKSSPFLQH